MYLSFRQIDDRLIALDLDGYLTTWSVVTGKLICQHQLDQDIVKVDGFLI